MFTSILLATFVFTSDVEAAAIQVAAPPVPALTGELMIRLQRQGRVESSKHEALVWKPEAYNGRVKVKEVVVTGGTVKEGDLILRLVAEDMDWQMSDAARRLANAVTAQEVQATELSMGAERSAQQVERTSREAFLSARRLARWDLFDAAKSLEMKTLSSQGSQDRLADENEELSQLEKLYEGAVLDGQTRDIVLNRARRALVRSTRYTFYSVEDASYYQQTGHADQQRAMNDQARYSALDATHALTGQTIGVIRAQMAEAESKANVAAATRASAKFLHDVAALEIRAPFSGVISMVSIEAGDDVSAGMVFTQLVDPTALQVKLSLPAEATRIAGVGSKIALTYAGLPACNGSGTIVAIGAIGVPDGDGTLFPAIVCLDPSTRLPPVGMGATIEIVGTLQDVLKVSAKAVQTNPKGESFVRVQRGELIVEVPVVVGARGVDEVELVSGIAAGELVHVAP
ncbi:MAG: HlyD family efflux transporter periplasmic adaptor subunit [Planctomycetota bacterium]|nr:HlyD family efflux transporter periplasmic adaptor subunit [Planctomycetota bacterium]